jgi:hypothetical protein
MADDDYEDQPVYLGVGSCHAVDSTKPKRVQRKQPIGFVTFPQKPTPKRPVAKKPQRRQRKR